MGVMIFQGGGGGTTYKTNKYMDAEGRVMVERTEQGETVIRDSEGDPILVRFADGNTAYCDDKRNKRIIIGNDGVTSIVSKDGETIQLAESILARTKKHLLSWDGEGNPIKEDGVALTHTEIYKMLMETPDFVVLVYADHAYHPNLVTVTQIAFTCSYASTNGDIVVERVTITNTNVVSALQYHGVTRNSVGGVVLGTGSASREFAFSAGNNAVASGVNGAHAEGLNTTASGANGAHAEGNGSRATGANGAHAEGTSCVAGGSYGAHAEGYHSNANGSYGAHAEGYYCECTEGADTSHAEGSYTKITRGGSHADGAYNDPDDMDQASYAHGCGTSESDRRNSVLFVGQEVYIFGVGGYDGTNHAAEGVKSLRQVLAGE